MACDTTMKIDYSIVDVEHSVLATFIVRNSIFLVHYSIFNAVILVDVM
jgi:hypothetical protein